MFHRSLEALKLHMVVTQAGLSKGMWSIDDLAPDAQSYLGAKVFEFVDEPRLAGMSEEMRYCACLEFHGIECPHPEHMRDWKGLNWGYWPKDYWQCRACGMSQTIKEE